MLTGITRRYTGYIKRPAQGKDLSISPVHGPRVIIAHHINIVAEDNDASRIRSFCIAEANRYAIFPIDSVTAGASACQYACDIYITTRHANPISLGIVALTAEIAKNPVLPKRGLIKDIVNGTGLP